MTELSYRLHDVGHRIGATDILGGIDLDVRYGRVLALVGPNGAGKSTLLGILSGDLAPHAGEVLLDGRPIAQWSGRELARTRAVLLQSNQVAFSFTARQVVEMGRSPWSSASADVVDDASAVQSAMERADVVHLGDRPFTVLSGGERARVSLARVLAQDTRVLLLDEPTAALDLRHQEDVLRIARELAMDGRCVVVVLHDLSLAAAYADEIAMIGQGRLVALGSPSEVLSEERIQTVYETPVRVIPDPDSGLPVVLPRRAARE